MSEGFESKHFKRLFKFGGWRADSVQNDKMSAEGSKGKKKKNLHSETLHHNGHSVGICDSCTGGTDHTNSVKCLYSFPLRYIYMNNFEAHRAKDTVYFPLHRYLKSQLLHRIFLLTLTQPRLPKSSFSDFCLENQSHKTFLNEK